MRIQFVILAALLLNPPAFSSNAAGQQPTPQTAPSPLAPRPAFDAFEVATIKPVDSGPKSARYITMQGDNHFIAKSYTLKMLIAAAYSLNPITISGGPGWIDSDTFDIAAVTPGEVRPVHQEQMRMLQTSLKDRFTLQFHLQPKQLSVYSLQIAKGGPKLTPTTADPSAPVVVGPAILYEESTSVKLPVRNATLGDFATLMQRAVLDRPVLDDTALTGRYDFDLKWAADSSQFGGNVPAAPPDNNTASLFTAVQEQLGLKLVPTRGTVQAIAIDSATKPTAN
jgi:uncharacterized protein (TIGR03435 family)